MEKSPEIEKRHEESQPVMKETWTEFHQHLYMLNEICRAEMKPNVRGEKLLLFASRLVELFRKLEPKDFRNQLVDMILMTCEEAHPVVLLFLWDWIHAENEEQQTEKLIQCLSQWLSWIPYKRRFSRADHSDQDSYSHLLARCKRAGILDGKTLKCKDISRLNEHFPDVPQSWWDTSEGQKEKQDQETYQNSPLIDGFPKTVMERAVEKQSEERLSQLAPDNKESVEWLRFFRATDGRPRRLPGSVFEPDPVMWSIHRNAIRVLKDLISSGSGTASLQLLLLDRLCSFGGGREVLSTPGPGWFLFCANQLAPEDAEMTKLPVDFAKVDLIPFLERAFASKVRTETQQPQIPIPSMTFSEWIDQARVSDLCLRAEDVRAGLFVIERHSPHKQKRFVKT